MPPRRTRWLWRCLALAAALILAAFSWSGWYVYNRGFTKKWREQLTDELRKRGFDFKARRLTLNPFEGLVAEDAHLYLMDERRTPLLFMSRAAVDINYINLILHKPFLNSLAVRGARLSAPVDMANPDGPKFRLRKFQAKLSFQPGELRLSQAEGECYGLLLSVTGTLLHPENFGGGGPPAAPEEMARRQQTARAVLDEIQKISFDQNPPRVEIRFNGDLAHPDDIRASAQVTGDGIKRGAARLEKLRARLDYDGGAFHLRQAELDDAKGRVSGEGDYTPASGETKFQLESTADLAGLARNFVDLPAALNDLALSAPPHLTMSGRVQAPSGGVGNPSVRLTGKISVGEFAYRTIRFASGETEFAWQDGDWFLRGAHLARPGGRERLSGDALSQPSLARFKISSTIDPLPFAALLAPRARSALSEWRFNDPPRLDLTATGASFSDPSGFHAEGKVALGRTLFRGVSINRLESDIAVADQALTYRRLTMEREEGSVTADTFVYDFGHHESRMQNVRCTLNPAQVSPWLDPDLVKALAPYRFHKSPVSVLNGLVQFDGGRNSKLNVDFNAPAGLDYTFAKKQLTFRPISGQIFFNEDRLKLTGVKAGIFDGRAEGDLDLSLVKGAPDYSAHLDLQDLDFSKLATLYFGYKDTAGKLTGSYRFTGRGDDPRTLHGAGMMKVNQGNVFAIPFLGPLSTIVSALSPGLGFDVAHEGSLDFLTNGGKMYTGNLRVQGLGFSMFGGGWLGYVDDAMNFRVRINARGLPGAVLYPVSKLLEYESNGSFTKPVWRPRGLKIEPAVTTAPPP